VKVYFATCLKIEAGEETMIDALITGVLAADPVAKTTRTGNPYCTCRVRVPMGEAEALFCLVTAFESTARDSLLALQRGDSVSIACSLSIGLWRPDTGDVRVNVTAIAHAVTTVYHVRNKRAEIANIEREREAQRTNGTQAGPQGREAFAEDPLNDTF
jgi:single-stranded DNA-binding protein